MKRLPIVTIGRHQTTDELFHEMLSRQIELGSVAIKLLQRAKLSPRPTQVQLVAVHLERDLNLNDYCTYEDIVAAGAVRGMQPCTMEMAYEARLDYLAQPADEFLIVMMNPELIQEQDEAVEWLLTLERLSNMGPRAWIRAHSKIICPAECTGKPSCWNPFGDPAFREVVFQIDHQ